jgi:glyoxylase-like metal-dependent hydrolase (beta-lactamase superfamily II)
MFASRQVGSRGRLFTFDDLVASPFGTTTNVYALEAGRRLLVCDTYLGPEALRPALEELLRDRDEVVVVNTHADWDHVWGNCLFAAARIIGHRVCRERMMTGGEADLETYACWQRGAIKLIPPTVTFEERLELPEFDVELFFSPGHTQDSITLYDHKDRVLVVGDNAERPIPSCIDPENLDTHVDSLNNYLTYTFDTIVPGHGDLLTGADIRANIAYLETLRHGDASRYLEEPYRLNHLENLRLIEEARRRGKH